MPLEDDEDRNFLYVIAGVAGLGLALILATVPLIYAAWELDRRAVERDAAAQAKAWSQVPVCPQCGKSPVPPVMSVQPAGAERR